MTVKEALFILIDTIEAEEDNYDITPDVLQEAITVAIPELKKRVLLEPTYAGANQNYSPFDGSPEHIYKCLCGKEIYEHAKYCSACGQKIDWS